MIREEIDGQQFVIQGFADCRPIESTSVLRGLRSDFPRSQIQLLRADHIAGKEHLLFAARDAFRAFNQHRERAHTLAVELLLYASCQRQISKAIQLLGVGPRTRDVALAAITIENDVHGLMSRTASALSAHEDDNVMEILSKKKMMKVMRAYDISKVEVQSARLSAAEEDTSVVKRLVIERSALLAVEK
jgi:KEOPS complex subunit Cgi121